MEQRIVKLQIANEYIVGGGVSIGAVGSHDDVLLEMDFRSSALWAGTTRRAIFSNALGENRTPIILTTNLLAEGHSEVYLVPVPVEAKDVAGECFLTVEGYIGEGATEILRVVTEETTFRVLPSKLYYNENPSVTPTEAEQLQAEIDEIKETIVEATNARDEAASNAELTGEYAQEAEAWAVGTRDGTAVAEGDAAYQNNSKWWSGLAEAAKIAAQTAAQTAQNILTSLIETANAKIAAAAAEVVNARSWAVGGTGTRPDEDTNNAQYWSEQAKAIAGGDYATKQNAQMYVSNHNASLEAHTDIRAQILSSASESAMLISGTVSAHNSNSDAHPATQAAMYDLDGRITYLELKYGTHIIGNSFEVAFTNLSGLAVTGVWNEPYARIEF